MAGLVTARRPAASRLTRRLDRANKRADILLIDLRTDRIRIKPRRGKKVPRLLSLINPRRLHLNRLESRPPQLLLILLFLQRARNTPNPQFHAPPNLCWHL